MRESFKSINSDSDSGFNVDQPIESAEKIVNLYIQLDEDWDLEVPEEGTTCSLNSHDSSSFNCPLKNYLVTDKGNIKKSDLLTFITWMNSNVTSYRESVSQVLENNYGCKLSMNEDKLQNTKSLPLKFKKVCLIVEYVVLPPTVMTIAYSHTVMHIASW